jgi:hypothetical protein
LLGRHVVRSAAHQPGAGDVRVQLAHLREPEVDHLHEVAARAHRLEDDVLRLQVAVDDLEVVSFGERRHHLHQDVDDAREGEQPVFVRDAREVSPAQVLHHQVELAAVAAEVDDPDRVRVVQPGGGARLRDEAGRGVLVPQEVRVHDLDGDRPAEDALLRPVDSAHAAYPNELLDDVAAGEGGPDQRVFDLTPWTSAIGKPQMGQNLWDDSQACSHCGHTTSDTSAT